MATYAVLRAKLDQIVELLGHDPQAVTWDGLNEIVAQRFLTSAGIHRQRHCTSCGRANTIAYRNHPKSPGPVDAVEDRLEMRSAHLSAHQSWGWGTEASPQTPYRKRHLLRILAG